MKRSLLALMLLAACAAPETPAPVATPVVAAALRCSRRRAHYTLHG